MRQMSLGKRLALMALFVLLVIVVMREFVPGGHFKRSYVDDHGVEVLYANDDVIERIHKAARARAKIGQLVMKFATDTRLNSLDVDELITMGTDSPVYPLAEAISVHEELCLEVDDWVMSRHPKLINNCARIRYECNDGYHIVEWELPGSVMISLLRNPIRRIVDHHRS